MIELFAQFQSNSVYEAIRLHIMRAETGWSEKGKTLLGVYWISSSVQRGSAANIMVKGMAGCTPQLENDGDGILTGCLRRNREKRVRWAPHSTGASDRSLCVTYY